MPREDQLAKALADAERAFLELRSEIKQLRLQNQALTEDRDYYRDAYHHLLMGKEKDSGH